VEDSNALSAGAESIEKLSKLSFFRRTLEFWDVFQIVALSDDTKDPYDRVSVTPAAIPESKKSNEVELAS